MHSCLIDVVFIRVYCTIFHVYVYGLVSITAYGSVDCVHVMHFMLIYSTLLLPSFFYSTVTIKKKFLTVSLL